MTYGQPQREGRAVYSGRLAVRLIEPGGMDGDIVVSFSVATEQAADIYVADPEEILDPNFQDFLDYLAAYSGFSIPPEVTGYSLGDVTITGSKSYRLAEQATPTE